MDYNIQSFATMAPRAMVKANATAKAAGKAFGKPKAAGKAFGKARAKAAGKAFGKAKAKAAAKAVAKSKAKAAAKAVGKAKAKAKAAVDMAVAAMQVQMFIVNGATDTPANTIVVDKMMAVDDVMDKIQEQEGMPHNQQRFVVEDVRAVSDYRLRIGLSQVSVPIETRPPPLRHRQDQAGRRGLHGHPARHADCAHLCKRRLRHRLIVATVC